MRLDRRRLLAIAGAGLSVGIAGCSDDGESGDDGDDDTGGDDDQDEGEESVAGDTAESLGLPAYSRWLVSDDVGGFAYGYLDWQSLEETDEQADEPFSEDDLEADPMLGYPLVGGFAVSMALGFGLVTFGLSGLLEEGVEEFDTAVEELLFVDETSVVIGEIDVDEIDDELTEQSTTSPPFDRTDELAGYDVYTSELDERSAIAVSSEALVFAVDADDPVEVIRPTLEAAAEDAGSATDESDDVAWLVATGGDGEMALGVYGSPDDLEDEESIDDGAAELSWDELEDAEGLVASLSPAGGHEVTGSFAAIVEEPDEDALEDLLGSTAEDKSVEVDGDRVSATATW